MFIFFSLLFDALWDRNEYSCSLIIYGSWFNELDHNSTHKMLDSLIFVDFFEYSFDFLNRIGLQFSCPFPVITFNTQNIHEKHLFLSKNCIWLISFLNWQIEMSYYVRTIQHFMTSHTHTRNWNILPEREVKRAFFLSKKDSKPKKIRSFSLERCEEMCSKA